MSNWGDVGTITVKAMARELLFLRQQIAQMQAPAVEPAQAVKTFWASENILKESLRDNISCILTTTKCAANTVPLYAAPPAIVEAVPVGRVLHWKGDPGFAPKTCIRGFDEFPQGYAQLGPWEEGENVYTVPPAIDDETRELVLRLCRFVKFNEEHCTPNMISLAKQICEKLEAGNGTA